MQSCFETMVSCKELVELGFKPYQAKQILRKCKEYLAQVEGIDFYYNRQVSVVCSRSYQTPNSGLCRMLQFEGCYNTYQK